MLPVEHRFAFSGPGYPRTEMNFTPIAGGVLEKTVAYIRVLKSDGSGQSGAIARWWDYGSSYSDVPDSTNANGVLLNGMDGKHTDVVIQASYSGTTLPSLRQDPTTNSFYIFQIPAVNIDNIAPVVNIITPTNTQYILNECVLSEWTATDNETGIASASASVNGIDIPNGDPIDTSSVGKKEFKVIATDNAENITEVTVEYSVIYTFFGFFRPVDNPGEFNNVVNVAKAGRAIPVKFSLSGYQGMDIFAEGYPRSRAISCDMNSELDDIEEEITVTAGGSSLKYEATTDQYIYVWKTDKNWTGSCRRLEVKLNDGTSHFANFTFKK